MSHLEITTTSQVDWVQDIEFQIDGTTKACFSITPEMTMDEVKSQFEIALSWLPKEIIITTDTVKQLLELLIPWSSQRINIFDEWSQEFKMLQFKETIENLEKNFWAIFSQKTYGRKVRWFLVNNRWYWDGRFDFWKAFSKWWKLAVLYSKSHTRDKAKGILRTLNAWTNTLDEVINVLIQSGFPISD